MMFTGKNCLELFVVYVCMHLMVVDVCLLDFKALAKYSGKCGRGVRVLTSWVIKFKIILMGRIGW